MARKPLEVRVEQCPTCIFRPGNLMHLRPGRLGEIMGYLLDVTPHVCHHGHRKTKVACRGGRNFQLQRWHRMGYIEQPTDEALAKARKEIESDGISTNN